MCYGRDSLSHSRSPHQFLLSLPAPEQIILSQEAQSVFLKNLDALRVDYQILGQDDQELQEEDADTVVNNDVPSCEENLEDFQTEENTEEQAEDNSNRFSPVHSIASSKTAKLKGKSY